MIPHNENIFESLGFVETRSYIGAIEASDAMVKAAQVHLLNFFRTGGALVTVVVKGDLASCLAAVDAGKEAAIKVGELISSNVIARPFGDTYDLVNIFIVGKRKKGNEKNIKQKETKIEKKSDNKKKFTEEDIIILLKDSNGMSLEKLFEVAGLDKPELRRFLKRMIDEDLVEKAGTKYFIKK